MHSCLQNETLVDELLCGSWLKVLWLEESKEEFINELQIKQVSIRAPQGQLNNQQKQ